jgi:membrane-associated protein
MLPLITALLPLTPLSLSDQILQYGIWIYLLVFLVIMLASTIIGGPIPDNTFLVLCGAVVTDDRLSMELLFVVAALGGFVGYEINYWSGRMFGLSICRGVCPVVLHEKNVRKTLAMMNRFGPVTLILSRFMPVLNIPSFIAGVDAMKYRRYIFFNLISSAIWCGILLMLGYFIGTLSIINAYLDYLTDLFIIILSGAIIITLVMFVRNYLQRKGRHPTE